jgi:hypothetical protein
MMQDIRVKLEQVFLGKSSTEQEGSFHNQIGLQCNEELVKCYSWSIVLYSAENWTLWEVNQQYLENFET